MSYQTDYEYLAVHLDNKVKNVQVLLDNTEDDYTALWCSGYIMAHNYVKRYDTDILSREINEPLKEASSKGASATFNTKSTPVNFDDLKEMLLNNLKFKFFLQDDEDSDFYRGQKQYYQDLLDFDLKTAKKKIVMIDTSYEDVMGQTL